MGIIAESMPAKNPRRKMARAAAGGISLRKNGARGAGRAGAAVALMHHFGAF
jgi:hypothetical protein